MLLILADPPTATVKNVATSDTSINQLLEVTAEEGDPAPEFSCSSDGFPVPMVTWIRRDSGGHFPSGVVQTQQTLTWSRDLIYTDSGDYECIAQNTNGLSKVTLNLLVKSKLLFFIFIIIIS